MRADKRDKSYKMMQTDAHAYHNVKIDIDHVFYFGDGKRISIYNDTIPSAPGAV